MSAHQKDPVAAPKSRYTPRAPARRRPRLLVLGLLLLATLVLGPSIAGRIPQVRNLILKTLPLKGSISIASATTDWWSRLSLRGVEMRDPEGEVVLTVPEIASEEPLWRLAIAPGSALRFQCNRPELTVAVRNGGSNLEDVLAPTLNQPSTGGSSLPLTLTIADGTVELVDAEHDRRGKLTDVTLKVVQTAGGSSTIEFGGAAETKGTIQVELTTLPANAKPESASESSVARLRATDFDLHILEPVLTRLQGGGSIAGSLVTDMRFDWTELGARPTCALTGEARVTEVFLKCPGLAEGDGLRSQSLDVIAGLDIRGGELKIDRLEFESEFGRGQITGSVDLTTITSEPHAESDAPKTIASLPQLRIPVSDVHGTINLDLSQLAEAFSRTIRLKENVSLTSGRLRSDFRMGVEEGKQTVAASVIVQELAASVDGQPIGNDKPLEMKLAAHDSGRGLVVDQLVCRLDSLQVSASGDQKKGSFKARCDLDKLARQLDDFVDLGGATLRGRMALDGEWQFQDSGAIECQARGAAEKLVLHFPGRRECREDRLDLVVNLKGAQHRVETADLQLSSGGDKLTAKLREPVKLDGKAARWPVDLRVTGNVASWLARVPSNIVPADWQVAGRVTGALQAGLSADQTELESLRIDLEQLSVRGADWQADEPLAKLETAGTWSSADRQLVVPSLTITSRTLAARGQSIHFKAIKEDRTDAAGLIAIQMDLNRLAQWMPAGSRAEWGTPTGVVTGKLRLASADEKLEFSADFDSKDFALKKDTAKPSPTPLALALAGAWNSSRDLLQLDQCRFQALGNACDVKGQISHCSSRRQVDLAGNLTYDLEPLARQFFPELQIVGQGTHELTLRGPLAATTGEGVRAQAVSTRRTAKNDRQPLPASSRVPPDLVASAGLGWSQAKAYGIEVGAAELDLQLASGVLQVSPLEMPVDEGKVRLAPRLLLNQNPLLLVHDQGVIADHLHLTPELCSTWLKFVAPLLADATQSDGTFSIDLAKLALPIEAPKTGDMSGTFVIHQAGVRPGGFALQLVSLGRQIESMVKRTGPRPARETASTFLDLPEQNVPFRMAQGRIWHEAFRMQIGDLTVQTSGSVGLDDSLDLTAEVPIPAEWVARDRYLKKLGGKVLKVPVRGTLAKPQIDSRAVSSLIESMAGSAAESAVEGLLEQQLNRLLPRGK